MEAPQGNTHLATPDQNISYRFVFSPLFSTSVVTTGTGFFGVAITREQHGELEGSILRPSVGYAVSTSHPRRQFVRSRLL
jgi:hypothetical protein